MTSRDARLKPSGKYEGDSMDTVPVGLLVQEAHALNASLGDPTHIA